MTAARPFLKWVGGKTQLLPHLLDVFPRKVRTYYEPFLGGGAVFFALAAQGKFERAVLSDANYDLMEAYQVVRGFPEDIMRLLKDIEQAYEVEPKSFYEHLKTPDLELTQKLQKRPLSRAARLIFLNKAGFNGLYRVNRKGGFNVPWGKKAKVKLFDPTNLQACSAILDRWASLRCADFETVLKEAGPEDLVYLDPPYVPKDQTAKFTSYTVDGFKLEDHTRLARIFNELFNRGCYVVASNADVPLVHELYAGFEIHSVPARRSINARGDLRGPVGEVIIVGRRA